VLEHILGFGPRIVALTRGENGALAASGNAFVDIAGIPVRVVDTVGAGDSFGAALIAALVDHGAFGATATTAVDEAVLARATSYAVAASAITCTRTGAVPPSRNEIETQLRTLKTPLLSNRGRPATTAEPAEVDGIS
jgi:fructokinase